MDSAAIKTVVLKQQKRRAVLYLEAALELMLEVYDGKGSEVEKIVLEVLDHMKQ